MSVENSKNKLLTLSCTELAKATNINKGCWSRYLNGEFTPSTANLRKISKAFHITIEEVLEAIDQRKSASA